MARSEPFWTPCAPSEARHRTRVQLRMWRTWSPELVETYRVRRVVFESWQGASSVQRLRRRLQGVSVEEFFSDRAVLPRDLQGKVGRARKVRGEAEVLQRQAAIASAEVAADLVQTAHLTVRDAGRVLGLSHQRITQLLKAASEKSKRSHGRGIRVAGAGRSKGDHGA